MDDIKASGRLTNEFIHLDLNGRPESMFQGVCARCCDAWVRFTSDDNDKTFLVRINMDEWLEGPEHIYFELVSELPRLYGRSLSVMDQGECKPEEHRQLAECGVRIHPGSHQYYYHFSHDTMSFEVRPVMCPDPCCRGSEGIVRYWDCRRDPHGELLVAQSARAHVETSDAPIKSEWSIDKSLAQTILGNWWNQHFLDLERLRAHLGLVCVHFDEDDLAGLDAFDTTPQNQWDEGCASIKPGPDHCWPLPFDIPPSSKRNQFKLNQPCPCGSGKKYKRCCRLRHRRNPGTQN